MIKEKTLLVIKYPNGREVCRNNSYGRFEYKRRLRVMWEEQGKRCAIGGEVMTLEAATFEHEFGRGMGKSKQDDRIRLANGRPINGAACAAHNIRKGSEYVEYAVKRK